MSGVWYPRAQLQPVHGVVEILRGCRSTSEVFANAFHEVSMKAEKRCHPLDNLPGDAQYRQAMGRAEGLGPVQHLDTQLPLESRA
jgi:hypothetical protein